jgi:hypothetical protein
MILSAGEPDTVRAFNLETYACVEDLRICGFAPTDVGSCVPNAVEENGYCRCEKGFYNNFKNECLPCHTSCFECVGDLESDCVNTFYENDSNEF